MEHHLGRKVQIIEGKYKGEVGTIVAIKDGKVGLHFDKFDPSKHSLGGRVPDGHGIWATPDMYITNVGGFYIGDRVIDNDGDEGTIDEFDVYEPNIVSVDYDLFGIAYVPIENLKKIDTKSKNKNNSEGEEVMELREGARVVVTKGEFKGEMGIIVFVDEHDTVYNQPYAVELDEYHEECHDCEGHVEEGYGYWFREEELEVVGYEDDEDELAEKCLACPFLDLCGGTSEDEEDEDDFFDDFDEDFDDFNDFDNFDDEDDFDEDEIDDEDNLADKCVDCIHLEMCGGKKEDSGRRLKFKVGDKVKIVRSESVLAEVFVGDVAEVVAVHENEEYPYELSNSRYVLWNDNELELVAQNHVFEDEDMKVIVNYPAVIVVLKSKGKQFKGVAKCDVRYDQFDANKGFDIAFRRALIKLIEHELDVLTK